MISKIFRIHIYLAWLFFCHSSLGQDQAPNSIDLDQFTIAIIKDGDSWYFDTVRENFEKELVQLASGKYKFTFKIYNGEHDPERVHNLLKSALNDNENDVIYCSGVVATESAKRLSDQERSKPILAGAVQFTNIGALISPQGTSSVTNYTFITEPKRVEADVALLKRVSGEAKLYIPIDNNIYYAFDKIDEARLAIEELHSVKITMIPVEPSVEAILENVPKTAKAIYIPLLPRLSSEDRKKLYQKLAERGAVTVAMFGVNEVELGALASQAPDNGDAIARRTALNIHQLLQGVSTSILPVYLPVQDQLIINDKTAQIANWSPTYEIALEANFINQDATLNKGEPISLNKAMAMAMSQNADVLIAREEERIQDISNNVARSIYLPQLSLNANANHNQYSDRINPLSPDYTQGASVGLELRQILFNDELLTNIKAQRESAQAAALERLSAELDATNIAAGAYLNVLSSRSLYLIERENLNLTQNNLQLSQLRVEIGSAEPSEIFRWQQNTAQGKAVLIQRETDFNNAIIELNRIMGVPRDAEWTFEDIELDEDNFFFMNSELRKLKTRNDFMKFGEFLKWMAVENSPELASFDYSINAQNFVLGQKKRRYFLPEISAFAGADRLANNSDLTRRDSENQLSVGVQFSFPIFEGGLRKAEIRREEATLRRIYAFRERAIQLIEQRAMTAFNNIGAAHPNILLSREALDAAQKNYEAVRDKYSLGAASILDLLDAQTTRLALKQRAAVAVYTYLTQVHAMQRSIAWFEYNKSENDRSQFQSFIQNFMVDPSK